MARTRFSDIARTFKPNLASLGYALFLAINAAGVWGGVFPFLPMNFQTPEITFWFFLAQSLVFSLCYFASAVGVYYFPGPTRKFIVMLASAPYLLGWCCLIGAIYVHDAALPLVVAGGALLGLGSAGFYMLWQRLFASLDADRGINPVFIYGFVAGVVYALHDVGFLSGTFAEQIRVIGMEPTAIVALVAVYLLGLMFFIGQGGFKRALAGADAEDIELMAGAAAGALSAADVEERLTDLDEGEAAPGGETARATVMLDSGAAAHTRQERRRPHYQDRLSKQAALVRQHYRLSARETEVMELIARGNTVARIAEQLVVSENTIRTHSKRIYAKLDIHKKQELLDLVETFNPKDLKE